MLVRVSTTTASTVMTRQQAWAMELSETRTAQALAQEPFGAQAMAEEGWERAMELSEARA